ncbi:MULTISPECIES: VOC family protein [Achromobacter]|uniref:VOC family protein n=1 Tax=Achromobacter spanius TaxID=217203 RepID=A0ABY8H166_9BURK|nr:MULTISPECIES: VOC family protein [Achromobacter]WAI85293.1 VOC family protein [Achromobacter spanius]WEX95376.1 VOC family protein [Achromobacter sp. SS2-2022]WFP10904.1 VOC family protein [Achromobacter spanius]
MHSLGRLVLLVNDYDTAISFYQDKLGMEVFADMPVGQQRYVHLRLPSQPAVGVWLLQALTQAQRDRVGDQTGGQPVGVFYTDDVMRDHSSFTARGVRFTKEPVHDDSTIYAHFIDLYGNEFILVQMKRP